LCTILFYVPHQLLVLEADCHPQNQDWLNKPTVVLKNNMDVKKRQQEEQKEQQQQQQMHTSQSSPSSSFLVS